MCPITVLCQKSQIFATLKSFHVKYARDCPGFNFTSESGNILRIHFAM